MFCAIAKKDGKSTYCLNGPICGWVIMFHPQAEKE